MSPAAEPTGPGQKPHGGDGRDSRDASGASGARRGWPQHAQGWGQRLLGQLPPGWRHNAELSIFGLTQVPMIFFCRPKIVRLDDAACWVDMPLGRRTRNHFKSMYFGALAVGADVAGGFLARHHILASQHRLSLIFKSFSAEFLKRPQADVRTACEDGAIVAAMVAEANASGERVTRQVALVATCPSIDPQAPVTRFGLEVSLKRATGGWGTGEH